MSALTREDLLKARFGIEPFEIEGLGTVEIRSVSRELVLGLRSQEGLTPLERERILIAAAMVNPKMNEQDVADWQAASPAGEMEALTERVARLSGMTKDSAKDAVKSA